MPLEAVEDVAAGEDGRGAHADFVGLRRIRAKNVASDRVGERNEGVRFPQKALARGRESYALGRAHEKLRAESLFEGVDSFDEGRGRHVEDLRRLREAPRLRAGEKGVEMAVVETKSGHGVFEKKPPTVASAAEALPGRAGRPE